MVCPDKKEEEEEVDWESFPQKETTKKYHRKKLLKNTFFERLLRLPGLNFIHSLRVLEMFFFRFLKYENIKIKMICKYVHKFG